MWPASSGVSVLGGVQSCVGVPDVTLLLDLATYASKRTHIPRSKFTPVDECFRCAFIVNLIF